ncbi:hypothetical protein VPNG_00580 [Cytospora leucostoma]|uniref:Uncharacterized protein n=1 Tax=Cytospora leucostoma TaxID=1230097 RepID=A0A423XLN5_9PEZI|nr:hypothetical protein VPNG_00580 [Cytospora leucostoma]
MSTSSRTDIAGIAPGDRDRERKSISYMWYIHVLVKVNTEDRLRDHTAPVARIDDLTDHLVLRFFDDEVLGRLVDTTPLFEHADAYARILKGVPERFREECCRRLYVLLFTMCIVEWPSGNRRAPHRGRRQRPSH